MRRTNDSMKTDCMKTDSMKTRLRRAFSLVEILFAIVVLSLGLLGIAAVFPVVITQQQRAQDVVGGAVAATAARGALGNGGAIAELILIQDGFDSDRVLDEEGDTASGSNGGNGSFDNDAILGGDPRASSNDPDDLYEYLWESDWVWAGFSNSINPSSGGLGDDRLGLIAFGPAQVDGERIAQVSVESRLVPQPSLGQDPEYVWDFMLRRAPDLSIEAAVFVRRIDPQIRTAGRRSGGSATPPTLSEILFDADGDHEDLVPLAFDYDNRVRVPGGDTSRGDGRVGYSTILALEAEVHDNFNTIGPAVGAYIELSANDPAGGPNVTNDLARDVRLLLQPGQRFVDNLGVVRTVVGPGLDRDGEVEPTWLRVSPPYTAAELRNSDSAESGRLRQILYTAEVPVSVFVVEVGR